jgi:hypothetical protein
LPFHGDKIVLLQKPLHYSSITYGWLLHTPPPQWCSLARIDAPQSPSALLSLDWRFELSLSAPQSPLRPRFRAPAFHSRLITSLFFRRCSAWMAAPLDRCSSTPVSAPWPGFAPSITFRAPPSTSALPLHSTSSTPPLLEGHLFFLRIHHIAFRTPF